MLSYDREFYDEFPRYLQFLVENARISPRNYIYLELTKLKSTILL